jgi:hypothetical protein
MLFPAMKQSKRGGTGWIAHKVGFYHSPRFVPVLIVQRIQVEEGPPGGAVEAKARVAGLRNVDLRGKRSTREGCEHTCPGAKGCLVAERAKSAIDPSRHSKIWMVMVKKREGVA